MVFSHPRLHSDDVVEQVSDSRRGENGERHRHQHLRHAAGQGRQ